MLIKSIDSSEFSQLVEVKKELFAITFYTASCPNCKTMHQIFEELLKTNPVEIYKINAEKEIPLIKELRLLGVPTTLYYRHGYLVDKKLGVKSKASLEKIIAKYNSFTEPEAQEYSQKNFLGKLLSNWFK